MILGAHESAAGGVTEAAARAKADGCESLQIFTRNSNQWAPKALPPEEIGAFPAARKAAGLGPVLAHNSYLVNLAGPQPALHRKSMTAMRDEIDRCDLLEIPFLVFHPGAHLGTGVKEGLRRIAESLDRLLDEGGSRSKARLLLEVTAGQGTVLGSRFEEVAEILSLARRTDRLGVCFDTCHAFAAGYDLSTEEGYEATFQAFDRTIGLGRLEAFHLNDSKKPLGSRVDRHEEIGDGFIGAGAFRRLVNDARFRQTPGVLETPAGPDGEPSFKRNLKRLRGLIGGA